MDGKVSSGDFSQVLHAPADGVGLQSTTGSEATKSRWTMRREQLEHEAQEIQRLEQQRRILIKAEEKKMRDVFRRLVEQQKATEADYQQRVVTAAATKMSKTTGGKQRKQATPRQPFIDGEIGAEILSQRRHKIIQNTPATAVINVHGEKLLIVGAANGEEKQHSAGDELPYHKYHYNENSGTVKDYQSSASGSSIKVEEKKRSKRRRKAGSRDTHSNKVLETAASRDSLLSYDFDAISSAEDIDKVFSVTIRLKNPNNANVAESGSSYKEDMSRRNNYNGGNNNNNANKKTTAKTEIKSPLRNVVNTSISIPAPRRGKRTLVPDISVEAIGYGGGVDGGEMEENKQQYEVDELSSSRDLIERSDDTFESTTAAQLQSDLLPVRIFAYQSADESVARKPQTNYDTVLRLPPIGNNHLFSLPRPIDGDAMSVTASTETARSLQHRINGQQTNRRWRTEAQNVKDVSAVSAMLTSIRLAPKLSSESPRISSKATRDNKKVSLSIDSRSVRYPAPVEDDHDLTVVSLPLLSLYGMYSTINDRYLTTQFDWPIPPAREPTIAEIIVNDDDNDDDAIDDTDENMTSLEEPGSVRRIVLHMPKVTLYAEE